MQEFAIQPKSDNCEVPKMAHPLKLVYQLKCFQKRVLSSSYRIETHQPFFRPCEVLPLCFKRVLGQDLTYSYERVRGLTI